MTTNDKQQYRGDQTPGLDDPQARPIDKDAVAHHAHGEGQGSVGDLEEIADAAGRGEGADKGKPPAGDVRTVYENERQPGAAKPQGE